MLRKLTSAILFGILLMTTACGSSAGQPAPEFPTGLDWLNTGGKALSMDELKGKVVLLDFWTYGCINCIHVIPDLKKLEHKYGDALAVIGVHSAKFEQEGKTDNIRKLVLRYELEHPVVNDKDFEIWNSYGVNAWPTLALVDPQGEIIGGVSGEGHYELLDRVIGDTLEKFEANIDRTPLPLTLERDSLAETPLLFPGKVLADPEAQRLFIADTNHHRILVTDLDGKVTRIIGGKSKGFADGDFAGARFFLPQGMTLGDADTLYVADTENHAIRKVDLSLGQVSTLAGNGNQRYMRDNEADPQDGLNSPWDLAFHEGLLFIAMAGQHQIWLLNPETGALTAFAGSRREALLDGKRLSAGLNQPSGLAVSGDMMFIADSEASAIRRAGLGEGGRVSTIVGQGLFKFGDVDGEGKDVRLQHPLGVVVWKSGDAPLQLLVADTYNSKIKLIDPLRRSSRTIAGGNGVFDEPGGLSLAGGKLYIADTNHHQIKVLDLEKGLVTHLALKFPEASAATGRSGASLE